jgi:hypothetical protein
MSDDLWLKELAQVHRERETEERSRFDERWDRLSAGTLSLEEEAELKALAETSEEARAAYEAFRPLGAEFQASIVQKIREQNPKPVVESKVMELLAKLLPFWGGTSRPSQWAGWGAAATVAAAVLFFIVPRFIVPRPASYPPLPVYAAEMSAGDQEFRGGMDPAAGTPVFSPGSILRLDVFPEEAVTGPVEARAFAVRGAEWVELEPPAGDGSKRLEGTIGKDIQLAPGTWRLWIVVGRPGKVPSMRDLQAELRAGRTRHEDWQAVFEELRVEDQASP